MHVDGRCHCGAIAFEADVDPATVSMCHCTDCQMLTGSAYRANIAAPAATFVIRGTPVSYIKTAESGNKRLQGFCPKCGSGVFATAAGDGPKVYGLRVGTLRQRDQFVPKQQIWARSAQSWAVLGGLPSAEKQ